MQQRRRAAARSPALFERNPNNKDDPYQRLLTMKPGEITEPINYQGRYFVLRRGEDVPKTVLKTPKKEIEVSLAQPAWHTVPLLSLSQKVSDSLKQTKDVAKTAQNLPARQI